MILTNEERQKFIEYLEHDANTSETLIKQLADLGSGYAGLVKKFTAEMHAYRIVALKLRSLTSETL